MKYIKYSNRKAVQKARVVRFASGRYGFETNSFGDWEKNMNMPLFPTEEAAREWIENNPRWQSEE